MTRTGVPLIVFLLLSFFSAWCQPNATRTQAVPVCDTWTFRLSIGSAQASDSIVHAVELPDNHFVLVGSSRTMGTRHGVLHKVDKTGNQISGKWLSYPNGELELRVVRLFSNGQLYILGNVTPTNGARFPVVLTVDPATLTVTGSFRLDASIGGNWTGVDLGEGKLSDFFTFAHNDSLVSITRYNQNGNSVNWNRSYRTRNAPRPIGMTVEHLFLYAAWNETDSGYQKGVAMGLDYLTGNYRYGIRIGGGAEQSDIVLQNLRNFNLRPRLTALYTRNGQRKFIRVNLEPTLVTFQRDEYSVDGLVPSVTARSAQNEFSDQLAFTTGTPSAAHYVVGTFTDNYITPIRGWRIGYGINTDLHGLLRTSDGGALLYGRDELGKLVVNKTDSILRMGPTCLLSTTIPATFSRPNQPYEADTIPPVVQTMLVHPLTIESSNRVLSNNQNCRTQICPVVPEPDSCIRTFVKEYQSFTHRIVARHAFKAGTDGIGLAGFVLTAPNNVLTTESFITFLDKRGRIEDVRIMVGPSTLSHVRVFPTLDGQYMAAGNINYGLDSSDFYLIKFNGQFQVQWQKKYQIQPHYGALSSIIQSSDGDYYCYMHDRVVNWQEKRSIIKLSPAGDLVWATQFTVGPALFPNSVESSRSLTELGDAIIIKYNEASGDFSPHLVRIRKSDGSIVWTKKYQMNPPFSGSNSYNLYDLASTPSAIYMLGSSQEEVVMQKIAGDGSIIHAKKLAPYTPNMRMTFGSNGNLFITTSYSGFYNPLPVIGVVELDTNLNFVRQQFANMPKSGAVNPAVTFGDSVAYVGGSMNYLNVYGSTVLLQKFNFNSSFGACARPMTALTSANYSQTVLNKTLTATTSPAPTIVPFTASFKEGDMAYSAMYCGAEPLCNTVDLQGPSTICDTTNTYTFRAIRNTSCNAPVQWTMDTAAQQIRILAANDTMVQIRLRYSGSFTIRARLFAGCSWIEDSITVAGTVGSATLNLGPDTTLCNGNSLVLQAGPGFGSYLWQNGSTQPFLQVNTPGWYIVQVTTCNNTLRDSVLVSAAPPVPLNLGPDRALCAGDSLTLQAPAGFLAYTWSNNYQINTLIGPQVIVRPLVDTAYYLRAEKTPGCFGFDTVRIQVQQPPAITLGADTSFCAGNLLTLDAGTGFISWQWSTGASGQEITVGNAGTYWVTGTTAQGCKTSDTLRVVQVWPRPIVNLDPNPELCAGASRLLQGGNFASYLWDDGSTGPSRNVTGIGTYWVQVRSAEGCTGGDTTSIMVIHPLPQGFLPPDTTVCSYERLELRPSTNFPSYLWSNGATSSTISISQPGTYWLDVRTVKGCLGRDTVRVAPRECLSGVFIPNAFTPNRDGLNDGFRPLVFGPVTHFEFVVYSRWGEVIFRSTEPHRSWDGRLRGKDLPSGTFVWTCTYQSNGITRKEKGTVALIR